MSNSSPKAAASPRGSKISVQPALSHAASSSPVTVVSTTGASAIMSLNKFRRPIGFFRVTELVLALISVSCMADVSGLSSYNELTAVIGIGVLVVIYLVLLLPLYAIEPLITTNTTHNPILAFLNNHLPLCELLIDASLTAMLLASFLASAIRCGSTYYIQGVSQGISLCQE